FSSPRWYRLPGLALMSGPGQAVTASAADRGHRTVRLQERRVVDAVAGQLHRDGAPPRRGQLGVVRPGPQRAAQVAFRTGEQAVPYLAIGGQPDPVAGPAERPGDRRDDAHPGRAAVDQERLGRRGSALPRVVGGEGELPAERGE